MAHATVDDLKTYLGIPAATTTDDALLRDVLERASAYVDGYTGRRFTAETETRYYEDDALDADGMARLGVAKLGHQKKLVARRAAHVAAAPLTGALSLGKAHSALTMSSLHASQAPGARRFLVAVGLGTAGFSMQDIILEPYGGQILGLSVGAIATGIACIVWALRAMEPHL
jgi:hypothetical protein